MLVYSAWNFHLIVVERRNGDEKRQIFSSSFVNFSSSSKIVEQCEEKKVDDDESWIFFLLAWDINFQSSRSQESWRGEKRRNINSMFIFLSSISSVISPSEMSWTGNLQHRLKMEEGIKKFSVLLLLSNFRYPNELSSYSFLQIGMLKSAECKNVSLMQSLNLSATIEYPDEINFSRFILPISVV